MNRRQAKTLRGIFTGFLALVAVLFAFPYIKDFVNKKAEETKEKPLLIVYVNGREAVNDDLLVFNEIGTKHSIIVKYSKSHKLYDQELKYSVGKENILTLEERHGDEMFVDVIIESIAKDPDIFYLQIENADGSFIFSFKVKTTIIEVNEITFNEDIVFTE